MMEKIEVSLFNIGDQTILKQRECSITLYPSHLIYVLDIDIREPKNKEDLLLGFIEESWYGHHTQKKKDITEVSVTLNNTEDEIESSYSVKIFDRGSDGSIKILFKTKEEAFVVRDKIVNWWLSE